MCIEDKEDKEDKSRYSSAEERLTPFAIILTCEGLNCEWLSAHNREVVGSKPTAGTSSYRVHRSVRTKESLVAQRKRAVKTPSAIV